MKHTKIYLTFFLIIIIELIGRYYGLHDYPLFQSSKEFEYLQMPNQHRFIYRNHFSTNNYSMRSKPIEAKDSLVVLLIGDSILYGGNIIDDDELASTILEKKLSEFYKRNIRVLNISCKSWGPDNNYQYLKKFGTFSADLIIYITNSGDAHDSINHFEVVGIKEEYPKENSKFAIFKLITKSYSVIKSYFIAPIPHLVEQHNDKLDEGFQKLNTLSKELKIPMMVYLHPDKSELSIGKYNSGGDEIVKFCNDYSIPLIKELEYKGNKLLYDDDIHYNVLGQKFMSDILLQKIDLSYLIEKNRL